MATMTSVPKIRGLSGYDLLQMLGEGGMGKVFLARHQKTGRQVVVKTIHEHLLGEAKTRQRFQHETDLMRRFRHPNAVEFFDASAPGVEPPFIVMEYVRGVTLDQLMQQQARLSPHRVGKILAPLCLFLQAAHDHGLLHRDLTPANIMVMDAETPREIVKVMDFGLARRIGFYIPSGQIDQASSALDGGTPDYVCPEQIEGRQVDHRGDLFSVGVLLYGLLTGHVPYEHLTDPQAILLANVHQPAPRFSHWQVADVPSAIEGVVLSCLCKSPKDRPETAQALIEAFELALGRKLLDEDAFASSMENSMSSLHEMEIYDPRDVIDNFEACMPEQMAAMKLRGFVDGVGGQVAESNAGVIRVRLSRVYQTAVQGGLLSWFGPKVKNEIDWVGLELHMAKKQSGTRSLVEIIVVRPPAKEERAEEKTAREQFCCQICRELRAYLMVGR